MNGFFLGLLTRSYRRIYVSLDACVPLRDLCTLLPDGATVETYDGNSIAFRTVIQLDGNVFTMVARSGDTEALWSEHASKVTKLLAHIADQINCVVRVITWPAGVALFGTFALCWRPDSSYSIWGVDEWLHLLLINILIPMSFSFLGQIPLVKSAVGKALLKTIPIWLGLQDRRNRIAALEAAASERRQHRPPLAL